MTGERTNGQKVGNDDMQTLAKRHLMLHFSDMTAYDDADMTMTPEGAGASSLDESGLAAGVDTGALDQGIDGAAHAPGSTTRGM